MHQTFPYERSASKLRKNNIKIRSFLSLQSFFPPPTTSSLSSPRPKKKDEVLLSWTKREGLGSSGALNRRNQSYSNRGFARQPCCMHGRNNRFFFPWEQMFFLMQDIFIIPAMLPCKTSVRATKTSNLSRNIAAKLVVARFTSHAPVSQQKRCKKLREFRPLIGRLRAHVSLINL